MQRKITIGFIILFLLGIAALFIFTGTETPSNDTTSKPTSSKQEGSPEKNDEATVEQDQDEKEEPESKNVSGQLKTFVEDTVKSTIGYFKNKETHFVAIGDSLTQGVGDTTGDGGYVGILNKSLNKNNQLVEFENYGKRGNRSDQLLKRLDKPEIATSIKQADIIAITIGANDIMKVLKENFSNLSYKDFAQERDNYKHRLTTIFDKVTELNPDANVYLLGFYNPFAKYFPEIKELSTIVKDWNTTGKNVAKEYENVTFIPTIDLFANSDVDLFAEDNFHPNTHGYKLMAKRVLEYLIEG
ncbi:SGNH/GDSL hydrolase family protein [Virgibacillus sp. FSP13]